MSSGIVVDANVMAAFTRLKSIAGPDDGTCALVDRIDEKYRFAIDHGRKIETQWFQTCGARRGGVFYEWFYARVNKSIEYVEVMLDKKHKDHLFKQCGFPRKGSDIAFIETAHSTRRKYLVSIDIDFWDPKEKLSEAKRRQEVMKTRQGVVCKYLRNELTVQVATIEQALAELP
jgi:hypothetical protein